MSSYIHFLAPASFRPRGRQSGYMLLLASFLVALVVISFAAALPTITAQIRRDKEVEMIHRGVEYTRAIQKYYTKANSFPSSVDQLLETNRIRFLRQKYKDPMTGKDFKLLRQTDPEVVKAMASIGGIAGMVGGNTGLVGGKTITQVTPTPTPAASVDPNASPSPTPDSATGGTPLGGQTFGGGPFIGVASTSKKKAFHVFDKKDHYNEWLFIYLQQYQQLLGKSPEFLIKTPFNGLQSLGPAFSGMGGTQQPLLPGAAPSPTPPSGNNNFNNNFNNNPNPFNNPPPVPQQ